MSKDLFAPPTKEEVSNAMFAPPSKSEVDRFKMAVPKPKEEGIGSQVGAGVRGAAQGISFGHIDEATAGVGGLFDYVQGKLGQRGDISLSDAYHTRRDAIRRADAKAEQDFPKTYIGGQVAGSLATAVAPGLGAMNAVKGAGVVGTAAKAAGAGALAGSGSAKEMTDIPKEAVKGAAIGAAVGAGAKIAGKVASAVVEKLAPAKVASVLLNVPEKAVGRYIKDPKAVNAARSRAEIVEKEFLPRLEKLKGEVKGGSEISREILDSEGKTVLGREVADIFDDKADDILNRAEGVIDDPQVAAAYNWLRDTAKKFRPAKKMDPEFTEQLKGLLRKEGVPDSELANMSDELERTFSTNRVKDTVQSLQRRTDYTSAPGQMARVDDTIRKGVSADVNALLKSKSPAYEQQMKSVAADTKVLKGVADLAKTPQGFDALLKRTQRGAAPHQAEALRRFDMRTGGGLRDELENSAVKEALERGGTNGSRNVNLFGATGDAVGEAVGGLPGKWAGRIIGVLQGATVDKYGPKMAKTIIDGAGRLERMLESSQGIKELGRYATPLIEAARNGNQALATTHAVLTATDPTYRQIMAERDNAMKRRSRKFAE